MALTASAMIGLATGAPIMRFAAFAGVWIGGRSLSKTGSLSEEEQVYSDIVGQATKMREGFDVA